MAAPTPSPKNTSQKIDLKSHLSTRGDSKPAIDSNKDEIRFLPLKFTESRSNDLSMYCLRYKYEDNHSYTKPVDDTPVTPKLDLVDGIKKVFVKWIVESLK